MAAQAWSRPAIALGAATMGWNFGLGLTHIVLPLYAAHIGLDALRIGTVLGAPVLLQLVLGLFGGAAADRWGGRNILMQAGLTMALGGLACIFANGFWTLIVAQLFLTYSRGVFWPASQSIAASLPGERAVHLGRLNAHMSIGQISGTALAGVLVMMFGYAGTFAVFAGVAALAMAAAATLPSVHPPGEHAPAFGVHFGPLLRRRAIWFALLAAFLCAQPVSLAQSFFPILLRDLGFAEGAVGPLLALRPLGAAAAALLLARMLGSRAGMPLALGAGCALAVLLYAAPLATQGLSAGTLIALIGVASGMLLVYYQLVVASAAPAHARGSALAIGGMGWGLSHLTGPFFVGVIAQRHGLPTAFQLWAGFTLLLALALVPAYRWARQDLTEQH
ncbi:MFS transporter [Immundisolibacter sp.]|uniref:MFS transporter n=1 Tax=Immundisolibacter sp. TaxID=1934948 RepID=UPI0035656220